ncbi:MAG TPA: VanZ family protein [Prolixibacteraceae bacterium]|nr:VanZ family protein [Prolixibacteraceae bacterium]
MPKKIQLRHIYPLIWYALLIYALLTPSEKLPKIMPFEHFDKVVHWGFFFGLSILLIASILKNNNYGRSYFWSGIITLISGIAFELLQEATTASRTGSISDALANTLGMFCGILCYQMLIRNKWIEHKIFRI